MKRLARTLAPILSLSILLTVAAPYQAAAQAVAGRVAPVGAIGAAATAASVTTLVPANPVLSGTSLPSPVLVPALTPSALTLNIAAPAAPIEAARILPAAPLALVVSFKPAAATPEKAQAPLHALPVLRTASEALTAASKLKPANDDVHALDAMYEGSLAKPEALTVDARSAPSDTPRLDPSKAPQPAKGPRWVNSLRPEGPQTPSSLKRTLSVGFLAAVLPILMTVVTVAVAQIFGYTPHPNYQGPIGSVAPGLLQAIAIWIGAAVMAPVSEEAIFRGGLQGRLAKLSAKLHLGDFALPAVITSVIFVALHETSDPVLFGTRLVHALVLSYVYKKEGILASMTAHGFFNGLLALSVVFTAMHMPLLTLLTLPAALYFSLKARKVLKSQKPAMEDGRLRPKPLTAAHSFIFAALLILGYIFIMPNIFWPLGALALIWAGTKKLKQ